MRANSLIITVVMSLSCVVLTASCVQTATPERCDEDDRVPGAMITNIGDGENGGSELSASPGLNPENLQAAGLPTALEICIAAGRAGIEAREAFCRSSLVPPYNKQACWSLVLESLPKWIGWCTWNY